MRYTISAAPEKKRYRLPVVQVAVPAAAPSGITKERVRRLQTVLNQYGAMAGIIACCFEGAKPLKVDGDLGPKTLQAAKAVGQTIVGVQVAAGIQERQAPASPASLISAVSSAPAFLKIFSLDALKANFDFFLAAVEGALVSVGQRPKAPPPLPPPPFVPEPLPLPPPEPETPTWLYVLGGLLLAGAVGGGIYYMSGR